MLSSKIRQAQMKPPHNSQETTITTWPWTVICQWESVTSTLVLSTATGPSPSTSTFIAFTRNLVLAPGILIFEPRVTGEADIIEGGSKGELSTGAIVGIAVGIGFPILLGISFIWFRLRRRKRDRGGQSSQVQPGIYMADLDHGYGGIETASARTLT